MAAPVKTPLKAPLRLPHPALAEAVAAEWDAQGEKIDAATMLFTKLANTAIDRVAAHRALPSTPRCWTTPTAISSAIAPTARRIWWPATSASWDPVVDWARTELDAPFEVTDGIIHARSRRRRYRRSAAVR